MACIKTGVCLEIENGDIAALTSSYMDGVTTVYGDLHLVGNCCVLVYPKDQLKWTKTHGNLDLDWSSSGALIRPFSPHHFMVIPARYVGLKRSAIHPTDCRLFQAAGGIIIEEPPSVAAPDSTS